MASRAARLLEKELRRRGVQFAMTLDGCYRVEIGGVALTMNIDSVSRDFERDGDPERIVDFLDSALGALTPHPVWEQARDRIYWCAERCVEELSEDFLYERVTDDLVRVLVITDFDQGRIAWLTRKCLTYWAVTAEELEVAAFRNLDRVLQGKRIETADGVRMGTVPVESPGESALKASTIFAPCFREFVEPELGWPVLAFIPSRDFIYVIAEDETRCLGRGMAEVVLEEFRTSGYPLTTELLRISDDGVEAIARFPE